MAWLVHEPRLRAEVPVFCVQAVKPLLINRHAPASVAVGAIHLLLHLHSRLEVNAFFFIFVVNRYIDSLIVAGPGTGIAL